MERESMKSLLTGISHSVASEMAVYSHTLALLMSKPRSSLEAGKKQPIVWLEYGCSMAEVTLYLSFGGLLMYLWTTSDEYVMKKIGWFTLIAGHSATLPRKHHIN